MAFGKLSFTMLDHNGEKSNFGMNIGVVTAATLPSQLAAVGTLRTAIEGITLGNVSREAMSVFETPLTAAKPANDLAQVETAWLIVYEDVSEYLDAPTNLVPNAGYHKLFTSQLATADISGRLKANSDEADLQDTEMAAFVAAFEANVISPYGGEVEVREVRHVGRKR